MAEIQQQRLHELLVQQVTRAVPVAVRVARNPLPERHGALRVGRLVLNVSNYLFVLVFAVAAGSRSGPHDVGKPEPEIDDQLRPPTPPAGRPLGSG
jgi:hypothetical protein